MRPGWRIVLGAMVLAGGACGPSGQSGPPLPDSPPVAAIGMHEYDFRRPADFPAGRVLFRFVNEGALVHQPDIVALADDVPEINEQLRADSRITVAQFAGIPPRDPGQSGMFAVDLVEGARYAVICFARDPGDAESHALKGMAFEFRAGGGPVGPGAGRADDDGGAAPTSRPGA